MYIATSFRTPLVVSAPIVAKPQIRVNREDSSCEWRLATMSTRFFLSLAALAVILVALGSATVQLTAGRRPVLLGGRTV
jgi:hypothetical protein